MIKFDRTNFDKLNRIDQITFEQQESICKQCKFDEECLKANNIFHIPVIEEYNGEFSLVWERCGKGRGKVKSFIDIKSKTHLFENEKKIKLAKMLLSKDSGYVFGLAGRGKTHTIAYIANELNKKGKSIYIELSAELSRLLTDYNTNQETMNDLVDYDVVIIDDIGSEILSERVIRMFYMPFLKNRIDNGKRTYFTSNYSIKELADRISKYVDDVSWKVITDRLQSIGAYEYIDKNFREEEK